MTKRIKAAPINPTAEWLASIAPITATQQRVFDSWDDQNNLVLAGSAGTGKTFIAMYLALRDLLKYDSIYDQVVMIRSVVPTRDMGFLPGTQKEKEDAYQSPYKAICSELFGDPTAYAKLAGTKKIHFESTSFIRGLTFNDSILIVDEMQNLNFHELDSVITRVGKNCKIIFCGDYRQSDFKKEEEKVGVLTFLSIIERMNNFDIINFGWEDIVRSGLVRDYLMTKEMLGIE
jgi:phosphate starvation-inducible PhoH-like protein